MHGSSYGEEGLKRVCSAPQLGDQDKAGLLKRKLSVSDTEHCVVDRASSKLKKQGQWPMQPMYSVCVYVSGFPHCLEILKSVLMHIFLAPYLCQRKLIVNCSLLSGLL